MARFLGGVGEPPLGELLNDPVMRAVLDSDGIDPAELDTVIASARCGLRSRRCAAKAAAAEAAWR